MCQYKVTKKIIHPNDGRCCQCQWMLELVKGFITEYDDSSIDGFCCKTMSDTAENGCMLIRALT